MYTYVKLNGLPNSSLARKMDRIPGQGNLTIHNPLLFKNLKKCGIIVIQMALWYMGIKLFCRKSEPGSSPGEAAKKSFYVLLVEMDNTSPSHGEECEIVPRTRHYARITQRKSVVDS